MKLPFWNSLLLMNAANVNLVQGWLMKHPLNV